MKSRYPGSLIIACSFLLLAFTPEKVSHPVIEGFTPAHSKAEYQLEKKFDSHLSANDLHKWMKTMTSKPNGLGSPHDKKNAEFIKSLFTKWGWDAHIEKFKVLFPTPKKRLLELAAPTHFKAGLKEPPIKGDPETYIYKNSLPPYNAYSADGDVTAKLVYVNQGVPDDYKVLTRHGISVKGKIVIVRYGGSWRGIKPRLAYEHGAVGCIIYSDPKDDGYRVGDTYPKGSWRPPAGVQRGSVMNMTIHPGGPLTPGIGADKNAHRLPRDSSKVIKKIPVLPISYKDAKPLLAAMGGPVAPRSWQGALPVTYHIGPGPAKVHLKLAFNWNMVTLYDVIAKIKGSAYPDQWVIRGNHHDGWVFGAADPMSGMVSEMGEAKAIGKLLKTGWRPKRTIVYCSWDGEEPGLLGSTEWVEEHAKELQQKAILYVNSDNSTSGYLYAGGSQSLQHSMNQVERSILDPERGVSLLARKRARQMVHGNKKAVGNDDLPIYALGSGSDYSPFLQHIGIASLNLGFGGEGGGGVYHSRYDTFKHYIRFGDPSFKYCVALSKTAGHTILRFADADVLPFRFSDMAGHIKTYMNQIEQKMTSMREKRTYQQKLHADSAYVLASNPAKTHYPPKIQSAIPYINFAPLKNAVDRLSKAAAAYDSVFSAQSGKNMALSKRKLADLNDQLQSVSQALLSKQGLPNRPWYRNMIYAPGYYTGYGVKTLPGVREAVEQRKWKRATKEITLTANVINGYADQIEKAAGLMKS
jgi:N-acetylated-alpha-linked acidic dipeptidase